jgi:hypothetical protein
MVSLNILIARRTHPLPGGEAFLLLNSPDSQTSYSGALIAHHRNRVPIWNTASAPYRQRLISCLTVRGTAPHGPSRATPRADASRSFGNLMNLISEAYQARIISAAAAAGGMGSTS